jgi:hypothetical protein
MTDSAMFYLTGTLYPLVASATIRHWVFPPIQVRSPPARRPPRPRQRLA